MGEARNILREFGIALVVVDGPSFPWFSEETARHSYIRFHGRNKEDWFRTSSDEQGNEKRFWSCSNYPKCSGTLDMVKRSGQ